jgi:multidrug transporter EmrE-like cation transporter
MIKYICLLASIIATSFGHIAVKSGLNQAEALNIKNVIFNYFSKPALYIVTGFSLIVFGFFLWILALRYFKISYAYSMTSLSYLVVPLMAYLHLGEHLSLIQWVGIGFICFGVIIMNL